MGILNGGEKSNSICSSWKIILDLMFEIPLYSSFAELWALKSYHYGCLHLHAKIWCSYTGARENLTWFAMIKFAIHIMCCPITQSQSVVFGNRKKHYINSISGLSPISSCFCPVHKRKIHVRSSSRTAHSHHCFLFAWKTLILLAQPWSYWLLLPRGVGNTKSHPRGAEVSDLACFLTFFNQILIGCSHVTTHKQYLAEVKKSESSMLWGCFSMLLK